MSLDSKTPFASVHGLGQLLRVFPYDKTAIFFGIGNPYLAAALIFLSFFGCAGVGTLLNSLIDILVGPESHVRVYDQFPGFGLVPIGITLLVLCTPILIYDHRNWSIQAAIFEKGFAYFTPARIVQWRWDEVQGVDDQVSATYLEDVVTHTFLVRSQRGEEIRITERLHGFEDFWRKVETGIACNSTQSYYREVT